MKQLSSSGFHRVEPINLYLTRKRWQQMGRVWVTETGLGVIFWIRKRIHCFGTKFTLFNEKLLHFTPFGTIYPFWCKITSLFDQFFSFWQQFTPFDQFYSCWFGNLLFFYTIQLFKPYFSAFTLSGVNLLLFHQI